MVWLTPFPIEDIKYQGVKEFAQQVWANLEITHDVIIEAHVMSTYQANRHQSKEKPFKVSDLTYLSMVNLDLSKSRACKLAPKYIGLFKVTKVILEKSNYELQLSAELIARCIYPWFHISLLRAHEPNDDVLFLSHESKHFYNFGMPDDEEWLVDEVIGHWFTSESIEFNIRWITGDHAWEPYQTVKDLTNIMPLLAWLNSSC